MDKYNSIIIVFPNWWATIPMPVATFLEGYNMNGKKIYAISTHEGSGMGRSVSDIRKSAAGATVVDELAIRGSRVKSSEGDVASWLRKNGFGG